MIKINDENYPFYYFIIYYSFKWKKMNPCVNLQQKCFRYLLILRRYNATKKKNLHEKHEYVKNQLNKFSIFI